MFLLTRFQEAHTERRDGVVLQDAREYFQYLLEVMTRAERSSMQRLGQPDQPPTAEAFKFELEDRIQCLESGRLSYKRSLTNVLAMDIPVHAATNKDELEVFQVQQYILLLNPKHLEHLLEPHADALIMTNPHTMTRLPCA